MLQLRTCTNANKETDIQKTNKLIRGATEDVNSHQLPHHHTAAITNKFHWS
jgi:hypothetical protein